MISVNQFLINECEFNDKITQELCELWFELVKWNKSIKCENKITLSLSDCLSPRGEGWGDQRGDEALHYGTGQSVWRARYPLQLHQDSHSQEWVHCVCMFFKHVEEPMMSAVRFQLALTLVHK